MTDRDKEAREALERVRRDSETVGTSSIARASRRIGNHLSAKDATDAGEDAIEVWGRRIGRALSVVGVVVLSFWLLVQLGLL